MTLQEPDIGPGLRVAPGAPSRAEEPPGPWPDRPRMWRDLALIVCVLALALPAAAAIGVEMSRLSAAPGHCLAAP